MPEEGYDNPEDEGTLTGSIPENTCYVNSFEADCNQIADNPDIYESDGVALGDEEYKEEKSPSDEGPQSVWDDDDQGSHGYDEAEERDFEIEYTGMNASMRGSIGVDVHAASSPRLSSWDLRRETSIDASVHDFSRDQVERISEQLTHMRKENENCARAFQAAGLKTPTQVVDSGITIFADHLLGSPTDMSQYGLSSDSTGDKAFRGTMKDVWDQHPYTNDITTPQPYKGRLYMALPDRAFNGDDGPFGVIFTHAMMHAAGAVGRKTHPETRIKSYRISIMPEDIAITTVTEEVPNRRGQHDLTWMNKKLYDAIIEACAKK